MSIARLAHMSAPVLSATLLMAAPAAQRRPDHHHPRRAPVVRPARQRRVRRAITIETLKRVVRPVIPYRVRRTVHLTLVHSVPGTASQEAHAATPHTHNGSRRAA